MTNTSPANDENKGVIPAQAGIQTPSLGRQWTRKAWIPDQVRNDRNVKPFLGQNTKNSTFDVSVIGTLVIIW